MVEFCKSKKKDAILNIWFKRNPFLRLTVSPFIKKTKKESQTTHMFLLQWLPPKWLGFIGKVEKHISPCWRRRVHSLRARFPCTGHLQGLFHRMDWLVLLLSCLY